MSNRVEALLSDADGTLVDTVTLIRHGQYQAAVQYLESHGLGLEDIPDYDLYVTHLNQTVGGPARHTLEVTLRSLYGDKLHLLDGVDYDKLHDLLNPVQDKIAAEFIKAYESLDETLCYLGDSEIMLAILTSGTPHHIVRNFSIALPTLGTLELLNEPGLNPQQRLDAFSRKLKDYYRLPGFAVITADDTDKHKPNPEIVSLALQRLGLEDTDQAALLGDHSVDMQLGINAGVTTRIGVTHGFDDRQTLLGAGATATIDSLVELPSLLG